MLTTTILTLFLPCAAAAERPPVSPQRLALVRTVTDVDAAPDGSAAFFVTDITGELELWSVPASGGWPQQLTDLAEWVTEPAVSPDGNTIAFAADRGGDERPDLYLVPAAGGEAAPLFVSTRAETSPTWSPDGKSLAFLADPGRLFQNQLFVLNLATMKERQLTQRKERLLFPLWSPDGRSVAALESGDDRRGGLVVAAVDGSGVTLVPPPVKDGIIFPTDWTEQGLLTIAEDNDGFRTLYLLDPKTWKGKFFGPKGHDVEDAVWHAKTGIVLHRNENGASALYRLKRPNAILQTLMPAAGRIETIAMPEDGRSLLYTWSDSANAPDVWRLDLRTKKRERLTRSMPAGLRAEDFAKAELISYISFDGLPIHAVYLKPRVNRLGTPPPLVVNVHGGPDLQASDLFDPLNQVLAEAGFAVLAPNYRGSLGFGRKFLDANFKDWGGKDRLDMIEGVKFLAKKGEIDPKRVGITGGSYGGYSTLFALAKNQGEWKAGVAAYGMIDLVQDYELAADRFQDWYRLQMGNPKDDAALFKERSAITHLDGLTAPLLIFQGKNDTNVLEAQAILAHEKLKALGRDVDLVIYPDEGHGFTRRKNLADFYKRTAAFFQDKLRSAPQHKLDDANIPSPAAAGYPEATLKEGP